MMKIAPALALATFAAMLLRPSAFAGESPAGDGPNVVDAVSRFTVELYKEAAKKPGNVFCSPLNVATALQMAAAGARGETAAQIARTLHLDGSATSHDALGGLIDSLQGAARPRAGADDGKSSGLWTANAAWIDERQKFLPDFASRLESSYGSRPHVVDFGHSPDAARETINQWVADQTRDKIQDLLKRDHVRSDTAFVLTSAIYFKGLWQRPFRAEATRDDTFHSPAGPVPARLMVDRTRVAYLEEGAFQAVSLPYKDSSLAMMILLPKKQDGAAEVEASLSAANLASWASRMQSREVQMFIPKFKSTSEFELKDALAALGMPDAFDEKKADFSGIVADKRGTYLSAVVHKAYVEVEERGTEAAAATAVVGAVRSAMPAKPVEFRADRPFLYLIRDTATGAILFIGRLDRP